MTEHPPQPGLAVQPDSVRELPAEPPPRPRSSARRTLLRRMGYLGLAGFTVLFALLAVVWLLDIDLTMEDDYERAIREFASQHRGSDLRFPGAGYQPVQAPAALARGFDLSSSHLTFVEQELDAGLAEDPGNSRLLFLRAQVHLLYLQYAPAIDILERLRVFSPEDATLLGALGYAHYLRGRAERNTGELLRASDFFHQALRSQPDDEVLLFNAAVTQQRLGNRTDATSLLERLLALNGNDGWAREARLRMRELRR